MLRKCLLGITTPYYWSTRTLCGTYISRKTSLATSLHLFDENSPPRHKDIYLMKFPPQLQSVVCDTFFIALLYRHRSRSINKQKVRPRRVVPIARTQSLSLSQTPPAGVSSVPVPTGLFRHSHQLQLRLASHKKNTSKLTTALDCISLRANDNPVFICRVVIFIPEYMPEMSASQPPRNNPR